MRRLLTCARAAAALLLTGCSDESIRVYTVPEEEPYVPQMAHAAHAAPASMPHLHFGHRPAGWKELPPERMRAATFRVTGPEGQLADIVVIPLPGVTQDLELESVNLWREQELGLEPLERAELPEHRQTVPFAGQTASLYDMVSAVETPGQTFRTRIIGAILPRPEALWFVKMIGQDELVAANKDDFLEFLKQMEFHAGSHTDLAAADPSPVSANSARVPPAASLPDWEIPAHWQERPPGSMLLANWTISTATGQADVTVSKLQGDGGGLLANVNRWRRQLGLPPVSPGEMSRFVSQIEVDADPVSLVDILGTRQGKPARTLALVVPRQGVTWFYKLMGDPEVATQEKDTFIRFVQSAY